LRQGVRICILLAFEGACIALELEVKLGTEKDSPFVEYWRRSCQVSLSAWNAEPETERPPSERGYEVHEPWGLCWATMICFGLRLVGTSDSREYTISLLSDRQ
jgi:hypothetical protein